MNPSSNPGRCARAALASRLTTVLATAVLMVAGGGHGSPVAAAAPGLEIYEPPVDAPVVDPFRPPPKPWLPGNRGIEYATRPGTPVKAAAHGVVTFAGPVAGSLHVTVQHADGIRTSASFLARVLVRAGQRVRRGAPVGVSAARLHVGARRGDTYIDPESLWARRGPPRVRLVPLDGGPRSVSGSFSTRRRTARGSMSRWSRAPGWGREGGPDYSSPSARHPVGPRDQARTVPRSPPTAS